MVFLTVADDGCTMSAILRGRSGELGVAVTGLKYEEGGAPRGGGTRAAGIFTIAVAIAVSFGPSRGEAARHMGHHARLTAIRLAPALVTGSIVLDADTGRVLSEDDADAVTYPASLTKMMTLYLTFEALNTGRLRLDQRLYVSPEAASRPPTKLGLRPGDAVQVHNLILGIVTRSANDAAAVLAEGLAGSEPAFAERMNRKAQQLGMTRTVYRNASGLPDPAQHTTARDMAQLALALYHDYPREYRYFATREFDFRGTIITGHNHLLDWYPGADGIKTGFIHASGFNLAASALRDGHRLIGVVLGGPSAGTRDREMAALLDRGFAEIGVVGGATALARREAPVAAPPRALVAEAAAHTVVAEAAPPAPAPAPAPALASTRAKPGLFGKAAARLVAHLAPVAKAEAAVLPHEQPRPATRAPERRVAAADDRWSIQLGAFHGETSAEKAARAAATLPLAKGKPLQIVEPGKAAKARLYRARLLHFTPQQAQSACAMLHKKKIECSVIPPAALKVAAQ